MFIPRFIIWQQQWASDIKQIVQGHSGGSVGRAVFIKGEIIDAPIKQLYNQKVQIKLITICGDHRCDSEYKIKTQQSITVYIPLTQSLTHSDMIIASGVFSNIGDRVQVKNFKISNVHIRETFTEKLISFRQVLERQIAEGLPKPHSDLAQGLVISGKGSMTKELLDIFKIAGLIHIVVLSGSNVSIISKALMNALKVFPKYFKITFGIIGMTMFACMTGASPPVVRSVLMSSIPLIFTTKNPDEGVSGVSQNISGMFLLLLTGLLMCFYDPGFLVHDISFQLSFMATLGLILFTEPFSHILRFLPEKFGIREITASSIGTQVMITPLLLSISDKVSAVFLITNLLVLPILPLTMFTIFGLLFAGFIFPLASHVIQVVSWTLLNWIIFVATKVSELPFAQISIHPLGMKGQIFYYLTTLVIAIYMKKVFICRTAHC